MDTAKESELKATNPMHSVSIEKCEMLLLYQSCNFSTWWKAKCTPDTQICKDRL